MANNDRVVEFDHDELKGKLIKVSFNEGLEKTEVDKLGETVKEAVNHAMKKGGAAVLPEGVHLEIHSLI